MAKSIRTTNKVEAKATLLKRKLESLLFLSMAALHRG
jgi:hypothetical protein